MPLPEVPMLRSTIQCLLLLFAISISSNAYGVFGDVNDDGLFNVVDIVFSVQVLLGLAEAPPDTSCDDCGECIVDGEDPESPSGFWIGTSLDFVQGYCPIMFPELPEQIAVHITGVHENGFTASIGYLMPDAGITLQCAWDSAGFSCGPVSGALPFPPWEAESGMVFQYVDASLHGIFTDESTGNMTFSVNYESCTGTDCLGYEPYLPCGYIVELDVAHIGMSTCPHMYTFQIGYMDGYEALGCQEEEPYFGDFQCENGSVLVPIEVASATTEEGMAVYGCVQCPQNAVYEFGYENGMNECLCELDPACVVGEEPEEETEDTTEPE
jgi:hypothetical protein